MLFPDAVILDTTENSGEQVIQKIISSIAQSKDMQIELAIADVNARERLGSTIIPVQSHIVAIPHAYTNACKQVILAVATSQSGIVWGKSGQKVTTIFLLLSPREAHSLYLKILSRLARLCETEGFLDRFVNSRSAEEAISIIAEAEEPLGEILSAEETPRFCVLGAGNGGLAMAGHLAILGYRVNLLNRTLERIIPIQSRGGIDVLGVVQGFGTLDTITNDPAQALEGIDVLMVVVPATGHADIAEMIADHIKDGQIIVLNPGRTGGALEVSNIIRRKNPNVRPFLAEAQTLLYASRVTNPGQVHIYGVKNSVPVAALPAYQIADILPVLRKAFPQFVPGDDVLKTSLDNIGAVFHPTVTILNAGRIEDTHGDFRYYIEGVTPSIARILEEVDQERVRVAEALGIHVNTAREWLYLAYSAAGKTLLEAMHANANYKDIKAPGTTQHRYISEDVPTSLVPIASIGDSLNVPTPTIKSIIQLASVMHGVDYWAIGRTVDQLGIKGMSIRDIRFMVVGAESSTVQPEGS